MHLKQEERCPIKSKSHLQNFFCICPSQSGMQTRHIFVFVSSLCVTRLWPCELWHLAFSEIIFRKMPFFSCFWQKINAFIPWAVLSVQKRLQPWFDLCTNGKVFYEGISVTEVWTWNKKNGFSWNVPCLKK